jgi:hypothetical protein
MICTILFRNIFNYFFTAFIGKIDIGYRVSGVPDLKTFKRQVILKRVNIGNTKHMKRRTGGRSSSGADGNTAVFAQLRHPEQIKSKEHNLYC